MSYAQTVLVRPVGSDETPVEMTVHSDTPLESGHGFVLKGEFLEVVEVREERVLH